MGESNIDKSFNVNGINIIYMVGLIIWIIIFPIILLHNKSLSTLSPYDWWYLLPYILGMSVMIFHIIHWRDEYKSPGYKTEVDLIEFAERNTSYLLIGISFLNFMVTKEYFLLIAMYFSLIVLFLWWISEGKKEQLVLLRHIKTLPYSYAICFFLAGIVAILERCPLK